MEHNKASENCFIAAIRIGRCGLDLVVLGGAKYLPSACRSWPCLGTPNQPFARAGATDWSRDGRAAGERLLSRLGMPISDHTILRAIKRVDVDTGAVPLRVVGVDDWAWKRGQTCGTQLWWIWSAGEWSTSFQNAVEESSGGLACPTPGDRIPQPGPARFIRRGRSARCASGAAGGRSFSACPSILQSEHRG